MMYANVICVMEVCTIPHKCDVFDPLTQGNISPFTKENRRMIAIQAFLWCKHLDPMSLKHQAERLIISSWKTVCQPKIFGRESDSNHWLIRGINGS